MSKQRKIRRPIKQKMSSHSNGSTANNANQFDIDTTTTPRFKVVLLGEGAVGKSSILLRFIEDKFNAQHESTIQAAFATKEIISEGGRKLELHIWLASIYSIRSILRFILAE